MSERVVLNIVGSVQGVGFRYSVFEFARLHRLSGLVENIDSGSVKIIAEGDKKDLEKLLDFCYNGVKYAQVDKVDVSWQPALGEFSGFNIIH